MNKGVLTIITTLGIIIVAIVLIKLIDRDVNIQESSLAEYKKKRAVEDSIKNIIVFDSTVINELKGRFKMKVDEFDKDTAFIHVTNPGYVNRNGIFPGFKFKNGRADGLFINIQYYADDWLFIKGYKFLVGDTSYNLIPFNTKRDNGDGMIWEWSSIRMDESDRHFLEASNNYKSGKVRYEGSDYYKVKELTSTHLKSISEGYRYYTALGGKLE